MACGGCEHFALIIHVGLSTLERNMLPADFESRDCLYDVSCFWLLSRQQDIGDQVRIWSVHAFGSVIHRTKGLYWFAGF
jgi:hypothetical protein